MIKPLSVILLATIAIFTVRGAVEVTLDSEIPSNRPTEGVYNNARDAFAAVSGSSRATVYVRPGVYWLDDPDSPATAVPKAGSTVPFAVEVECDTLSIIATDADAEATVFAVNRGQTQGAIGNFTMMHFIGRVLRVENMTFGNYCNVDLEYPRRRPTRRSGSETGAPADGSPGFCRNALGVLRQSRESSYHTLQARQR